MFFFSFMSQVTEYSLDTTNELRPIPLIPPYLEPTQNQV